MFARLAFSTAFLGVPLRSSFRTHFCSIEKWALPQLFSSTFKRALTVSYVEPPSGRVDAQLPGRLPIFEGAGVEVTRMFVQDNEVLDTVDWDRVEALRLACARARGIAC
eukprot:TRINITY_DN435_c0_g1_i1.p1 TRINITY_DN435_c0_g1~~TRINITY_DN435_c0_g1_i1.p1  ORF type:complete len:109 (+),score=9.50 TRINITY_DN435_c0_g1_i1:361-687(+)